MFLLCCKNLNLMLYYNIETVESTNYERHHKYFDFFYLLMPKVVVE